MLRIVIAEDEDILREGLVGFMNWSELGYEVVGEAVDGRQAKAIVDQTEPDVLITDIKMPYMDGLTLCEILKEEKPELKLIILSGHDEFEYARRAIKAGVCEYVLKPIKMDQLNQILTDVSQNILLERQHKMEYRKLKKIKEHSVSSIKNKVFTHLLLHKCSMDTLQEEISMLGQSVMDRYYVVGIIERQDFPMIAIDRDYLEIVEIDKKFGAMVLGLTELEGDVDILRSGNCERLICISGRREEEVKEKMQHMLNLSNQDDMEAFEFSFGHIYKGLQGLLNSLSYARKIKEMKYVQTWKEVLKSENKEDANIKYLKYKSKDLFFEIQSGTPESVNAELDKFEMELIREKIISHMHMILVVSNLYYELVKLPEEVGKNIEHILGNPTEIYHRLIGQPKRKEMIGELRKICLKLHVYFSSLQEGKMKAVVKRITAHIRESYAQESFSMKDVAEHAYISISYLSIILKKETGKTFIEYLTEVRMEQAKKFLTETNMKNYEVAEACGYSNPTYFSTVFKGVCGMSPSAYRKECEKVK